LQICAGDENCALSFETKTLYRTDGLHAQLAQHMSNVTFKLALSDEEKKVSVYGGDNVTTMTVETSTNTCAKQEISKSNPNPNLNPNPTTKQHAMVNIHHHRRHHHHQTVK